MATPIPGAMAMSNMKKVSNDKQLILTYDFITGHEYEIRVRAVGPDDTNEAMEHAPCNTLTIQGKLTVPNTPTTLTAAGFMESITLIWENPVNYDFSTMEIWRSATDDVDTAAKIAEVAGVTYTDIIDAVNERRYYWIKAVNTSGGKSDLYPTTAAGVGATTRGVASPDITDFSITATKLYTKTIILSGDAWTDNSPGAGSVSWNAHTIIYDGTAYPIAAGSSATAYVYWAINDPAYGGSTTHPAVGNAGFVIATNTAGIHTLVWNSASNMVIGNAFITNAAITTAKIDDLAVTNAKIHSIDADIVAITNLVVGGNVAIGSAEDAAGVTTIVGNTITTGYVDALGITVLGAVTAGSLTGLTMQTAAADNKRIVIDGVANNLQLLNAANATLVLIDDGVYGSIPGMKVTSSTGAEDVHILSEGILVRPDHEPYLNFAPITIANQRAASDIHDMFRIYDSDATNTFRITAEGHVQAAGGLTLSSSNIAMTHLYTVDGRDVSADGGQLDTNTGNVSTLISNWVAHRYAGGAEHADVTAAGADGFMTGADKTKLNGIEALADKTDATNVAAATAVMDADFAGNGVCIRDSAGTYSNTSGKASGTFYDVDINGDVQGQFTYTKGIITGWTTV